MSNEKEQTPIQFFAEITSQLGYVSAEILEKAKEMEKQQKRKDFTDGYMHGNDVLTHEVIDKWYEKKYGGNK